MLGFNLDKAYDNTPVGTPLGDIKAYLLDEDGNEAQEGELCLTGHFAKCYINLDRNNIEYEYRDITESLQNLKEFIKLRDKDTIFDDAKANGYLGIPALVGDDGTVTLDWESYFSQRGIDIAHPGSEGAACSIDGKGC